MKRMLSVKIILLAAIASLSACVTLVTSAPPTVASANGGVKIDPAAFKEIAPTMSATQIGSSDYYIFQTRGGSILLGPLLGAMNVQAQTKELAEKSKGQIVATSVSQAIADALASRNVRMADDAGILLRPMVVAQRSVNDKFLLSLYVQAKEKSGSWTGQYAYHLPMSISLESFAEPSTRDLETYRNELVKAANGIAYLIQNDLHGSIPATGPAYMVGSKNLFADRIGGMGIYTQPEELYFKNAMLVGTDGANKIIRFPGQLGGQVFGLHSFEPRLMHKFEPIP